MYKRQKQDSIKLGLELDRRYIKKEMPSRMKIGVAGCPNSCAESAVKDIGIIGTDKGWDIYVGGSAGAPVSYTHLKHIEYNAIRWCNKYNKMC